MMRIDVEITGISPLLMHKMDANTEEKLENGKVRTTITKKETPRERAEKAAYRDKKGFLYIPSEAIMGAMIYAGTFLSTGRGNSKFSTAKTSIIPAGITVEPYEISLKTKNFEVDVRRGVNPVNGTAVMIARPRLDSWKVNFTLNVDDEIFPDWRVIRQLVDYAGTRAGLLSYRPQKKGPFGRFKVTQWKIINEKK